MGAARKMPLETGTIGETAQWLTWKGAKTHLGQGHCSKGKVGRTFCNGICPPSWEEKEGPQTWGEKVLLVVDCLGGLGPPACSLAHCPQRSRPRSVARPSGLQVSQPPPRALPPRGATRKEGKEARPPDRPAQTNEQGRERRRGGEREGGRAEGNRKIIYGDGPRCIGRGGHRKEGGKGRSGAVARLANEQRRRELLLRRRSTAAAAGNSLPS